MKTFNKVNAILGGIITIGIILGVLFKSMHWPGGGLLIVLFSSSLSLYVIPVAIANILNYKKKTMIAICNGPGVFAGMILSTALLFKIQHWPGSGVMMLMGTVLTIFVCIIFLIGYMTMKEPVKLSPGTFFVVVSFAFLLYAVSIGGSSRNTLLGIMDSVNMVERGNELSRKNADALYISINSGNQKIYGAANDLHKYIKDLKSELYSAVDGLPKEIADTISLNSIYGIDNYDIPTHLLGIAEPGTPVKVPGEELYSAITLREKIEEFNKVLLKIDPNENPINTEPVHSYNGGFGNWEADMFYHHSLAQVILILDEIEMEAFATTNYQLSIPKKIQ